MLNSQKTQVDAVLEYLQSGKEITADIARLSFGVRQLPNVISRIKERGNTIKGRFYRDPNGNRFKIYTLGS